MLDKIKRILRNDKNQKTIFIVAVIVIVLLSLLLIISRNFGTFNNVSVRKNNKKIFSIEDLTVNDLKFYDSKSVVEEKLGKPKKEKDTSKDNYSYKILYYDGLTLTLRENYEDFILVKAEITSDKYKINRNIKVGNRILRVIKKFKVDNSIGTYLYGNYTTDALNNSKVTENVYMGLRSNKEVVYINKDASVDNLPTNIARLNITYKFGKVAKIVWSYDYK